MIEVLAPGADPLLHQCGGKQLGGLRRRRTCGQHIKVRKLVGADQHFLRRMLAGQQSAQAASVAANAERVMHGRPAQVGIHQQHAAALLGQDDATINRRGGFAFLRQGAGHQNDLRRRAQRRKQNGSTQRPVGFRDLRFGMRMSDHLHPLTFSWAQHNAFAVAALSLRRQRNTHGDNPQRRQGGDDLHLLGRADGAIHDLRAEGQHHAGDQPGGQA